MLFESSQQHPGEIQFPEIGVYEIRLVVTDELGREDPAPPTRIVTVIPRLPVGRILIPEGEGETVIQQHDVVRVAGEGTSASGAPVTYAWTVTKIQELETP